MMPQGCSGLEDAKHFFIQMRLQRIEASFTWTSEVCPPRSLLLIRKWFR
jgi:hypothetical protein